MSKEYADYPKGQISFQGGELQDAFDISVPIEGGEQTVHTFKNKGMASGSTGGKRKGSVTFQSAISETGFERDYLGNATKRKVVSCRVKLPGKSISITGRLDKLDVKSNIDGFITFTCTLEGRYDYS